MHDFLDMVKTNFPYVLWQSCSRTKLYCGTLGKQGKWVGKSWEWEEMSWKWMWVLYWHGLGPIGATEQRGRKPNFDFLWLGFWSTSLLLVQNFSCFLQRLESTYIHQREIHGGKNFFLLIFFSFLRPTSCLNEVFN